MCTPSAPDYELQFVLHARFDRERRIGLAAIGEPLATPSGGNAPIQRQCLLGIDHRHVPDDLHRMLQLMAHGRDQAIVGCPRVHFDADVSLPRITINVRYARSDPAGRTATELHDDDRIRAL